MSLGLTLQAPSAPAAPAAITFSAGTPIISTGPGPGPQEANCPPGTVLFQINARNAAASGGNNLAQLYGSCQPLTADGLNRSGSVTVSGTYGVDAGSSPVVDSCSASGQVIVGFKVWKNSTNNFVSGIQLRCGTLPMGGSGAFNANVIGVSAGASGPEEKYCPLGQVAVGLYLRAGTVIDQFGVNCAELLGLAPYTVVAGGVGTTEQKALCNQKVPNAGSALRISAFRQADGSCLIKAGDGDSQLIIPEDVSRVRALVVAGGGGGGASLLSEFGGGGGAGGSVNYITNGPVDAGSTISISVGAGGRFGEAGVTAGYAERSGFGYGATGGNSSITLGTTVHSARGGTGGFPGNGGGDARAYGGGSYPSGLWYGTYYTLNSNPVASYERGGGWTCCEGGGGGAGAGQNGGDAIDIVGGGAYGGAGGLGLVSPLSGNLYGGGGGGGTAVGGTGGIGATGGNGGNGGNPNVAGSSGGVNTGGGGGGGGTWQTGGYGGSGIVEIVIPSHSVTFNNTGADGGSTPASQSGLGDVTLNTNTLTKAGHIFDGWATTNGGSVAYSDGERVPTPSDGSNLDLNLYPVWLNLTGLSYRNISQGGIVIGDVNRRSWNSPPLTEYNEDRHVYELPSNVSKVEIATGLDDENIYLFEGNSASTIVSGPWGTAKVSLTCPAIRGSVTQSYTRTPGVAGRLMVDHDDTNACNNSSNKWAPYTLRYYYVPEAPTVSNIVRSSNGTAVDVSFTTPTAIPSVMDYEYSTDGGTTWKNATGSSSPMTISTVSSGVGALSATTDYNIRIRAINSNGTGLASDTETSLGAPVVASATKGSVLNSVKINYTQNGSATSHQIKVYNAASGGTLLGTLTNSFDDTNILTASTGMTGSIVGGTQYWLSARAFGNGTSTFDSAEIRNMAWATFDLNQPRTVIGSRGEAGGSVEVSFAPPSNIPVGLLDVVYTARVYSNNSLTTRVGNDITSYTSTLDITGATLGLTPGGTELVAGATYYVTITADSALAALRPITSSAAGAQTMSAPGTPDLVAASDSGSSSTDNYTNDDTPTFTGTGTTGFQVELLRGGSVVGTATVVAGTYTVTASSTTTGTFTVRHYDPSADSGDRSLPSAGLSVTIDTTAPSAPTVNALSPTDDRRPSLTFSGEGGATFECKFNSGSYSACTSPVASVTDLPFGVNTLYVRQTDVAGNVSTDGSRAFNVRQPLNVPSVSLAPSATTAGAIAVTASSANAVNYEVQVYSDAAGNNLVKTESSYTSGANITGLTQGTTYYVKVRAKGDNSLYTDSAYSAISASGAMATVQLEVPTNVITSTGTAAGSIKIAFTAPTNAAPDQRYTVKVYSNGALTSQVGSDRTNYVSGTDLTGFAGGTTYFALVIATASTGYLASDNSAPSDDAAKQVKLATPTITSATSGSTPGSLIVNYTGVTNGGTYAVLVYAADGTTLIGTVSSYTSGSPFSSVTNGGVVALTANTQYRVAVRANAVGTDYLESDATALSSLITPPPAILDLATASDSGLSNSDDITNDDTPTFTGTGINGATVRLYIGETEIGSAAVASGAWTITTSSLSSDGVKSVVARQTLGTESPSSSGFAITLDTAQPSLPTAAIPSAGTTLLLDFTGDTSGIDNRNPEKATTTRFTVRANGSNVDVTSVAVSGNVYTLSLGATIQKDVTVTFAYSDLTGGNDASGVIQDKAGNDRLAIGFTDVTVSNSSTQDNVAPTVVSVTSPAQDITLRLGESVTIQVRFTETVNVTGTPQLKLNTKAAGTFANYVSGSGTNLLSFTYTVVSGDSTTDLEYVDVNALTLNGGTITDTSSNVATLTLPAPAATGSLSQSEQIAVDASVAPTPTPTPTPAPPVAPTPAPPVATPTSPVTGANTPSTQATLTGVIQGTTTVSNSTVTIIVPSGATSAQTTFSLAPGGTTSDVTAGYLIVNVTATAGTSAVTTFTAPIQINLPAGALDGVVAWSTDGNVWFPITKLTSLALPANLQDGYFVNSDGSISILTRHFTLFGWRKAQTALSVSASSTTVQLGATSTLSASGGTGTGALKYATSTASLCSVTDAGVVTALAAGTCQITVTKWATLNLLSASQSISLAISDSDAKAKAEADAKAKAEADAKAKAEADAKAKAEADAKAKAEADAKAKAEADAKAKAEADAKAKAASRIISVGARSNGKTPVRVNLPTSFNGQRAILQRAKPGQSFTLLFTRVLDSQGNTLFQVSSDLKSGDTIRVRVGNRTLGSIVIP